MSCLLFAKSEENGPGPLSRLWGPRIQESRRGPGARGPQHSHVNGSGFGLFRDVSNCNTVFSNGHVRMGSTPTLCPFCKATASVAMLLTSGKNRDVTVLDDVQFSIFVGRCQAWLHVLLKDQTFPHLKDQTFHTAATRSAFCMVRSFCLPAGEWAAEWCQHP